MKNVVMQKTANYIEWALKIGNSTCGTVHVSDSFSIQNRKCHLELLLGSPANLYLKSDENLQLPLKVHVSVVGVGTAVSFSDRKEQTIANSNTSIYQRNSGAFGTYEYKFEITLIHDVDTSQDDLKPVPSYKDASFSLESLSHDLSKMLDEGPNHDVEFTCGDQIIKAHKSMLCSRSSVFASMLQSDMVEGKTGKVDIHDMDPAIFRAFLRCLYTGTLPELTAESAVQFYEASDKYGVHAVKKQCADFLIDNLSVENVCDILVLSDQHSDAYFKNGIVEYIIKENIPYVGQKWTDFCNKNATLAVEVLNLFCQQFRPK